MRLVSSASPPVGVRCRDEFEMEAGQMLIDKKYHMDALLLSEAMLKEWKYV